MLRRQQSDTRTGANTAVAADRNVCLLCLGPALATGPVRRVWFSTDGKTLYARTDYQTFATSNLESWQPVDALPPSRVSIPAARRPEAAAELSAGGRRIYAAGNFVYASDDGGQNWSNLTSYQQQSILGGVAHDIAVSPTNSEEVVVASDTGVWRSIDSGTTWAGLNQVLPNLPIQRLVATPANGQGVRAIFKIGANAVEMEWAPGERLAWQPSSANALISEQAVLAQAGAATGIAPTAAAAAGLLLYAGAANGQFLVSSDGGRFWQRSPAVDGGTVVAIYADPAQPTTALAVLTRRRDDPNGRRSRIYRTTNRGTFWDDLTNNLPDVEFHGITADRTTGNVYVAGDRGVFTTKADLLNAAPATPWTRISEGLPDAPAMDVKLDPVGQQVYVALAGYGVYATAALRDPNEIRALSTADLTTRVAAPGALMSIFGSNLQSTRLGDLTPPVLSTTATELQIQVPFDAPAGTLPLSVQSATGAATVQMLLAETSPVIFLDPDGSPWLLNAETGTPLDAQHPARGGSHVQILCTGLGRVRPDWPTGQAAPLTDPPQVIAGVRVLLGDTPLEVTRATLAPGYVGYYLVEAVLPAAVNAGPAVLTLQSAGRSSNAVSLYLEP